MSEARSDTDKSLAQQTSPYGYPYWEWVAREDPEYAKARIPLSELSVGEGKALSIKYREMVIIGILAFRGTAPKAFRHICAGPFNMGPPNVNYSKPFNLLLFLVWSDLCHWLPGPHAAR